MSPRVLGLVSMHILARLRALVVPSVLFAPVLSCDSGTDPDDDRLPTLTVNGSIAGRVSGMDSLTYAIRLNAGEAATLYVLASDSGVRATVLDAQGRAIDAAEHAGRRQTTLSYFWATVTAGTATRFTVRVAATQPSRVGGAFELRLVPFRRTPETESATLAFDDTVDREILEHPGDEDEFEFTATPQDELFVFMQTRAPAPRNVWAIVTRADTTSPQSPNYFRMDYYGVAADEAFEPPFPLRLQLPATGRYRLRVRNSEEFSPDTSAQPYRLLLRRRQRAL